MSQSFVRVAPATKPTASINHEADYAVPSSLQVTPLKSSGQILTKGALFLNSENNAFRSLDLRKVKPDTPSSQYREATTQRSSSIRKTHKECAQFRNPAQWCFCRSLREKIADTSVIQGSRLKGKEEVNDYTDMIACDLCNKWYHYQCLGLTKVSRDSSLFFATSHVAPFI